MKQSKHFKRMAFTLSAKWMMGALLLLIAMLMPQGAWAGTCANLPDSKTYEVMSVHYNGTASNYNGSADNDVLGSLKFRYWLDVFNYDGDNGYWAKDLTMKIDDETLTFYTDYACTTKVSAEYSTVLHGVWPVFDNSDEDRATIGKNKSGSGKKAYFKTSSGLTGYIDIFSFYAASNKWTTMRVEVFIYDLYGHKVSVCGTYKRKGASDKAYNFVYYLGGCPRPKNVTTSRNTTTKQVTVSWQKETYSIPASDAAGETRRDAFSVIDNGSWGVYRNNNYATSIQTVSNTTTSAADNSATCSSSPYTYYVCYEPEATYGSKKGTSLPGSETHKRGLVGSSSITLNHVWGDASWSWKWDDDEHSATCTRACTQCSQGDASKTSVTVTLNKGITSAQQVAPTCTTKGTTRYKATATVAGTQYTSIKDVDDLDVKSHNYTQKRQTEPYHKDDATCGEAATYWYKCLNCDDKSSKDFFYSTDANEQAHGNHTFAADDAAHGVCTVCGHGFLRYTSVKNVVVTPSTTAKFYNGNTQLTILSNKNGVIEFNKPLTKIGYSAFQSCFDLTSLTLPSTLTALEGYAFGNCSGLSGTLTIPSSVTSIGENAFSGSKYTTVRCESITPPTYGKYVFNSPGSMTLLVPYPALSAYKAANGWKTFKSIGGYCIEHSYDQQSTNDKYAVAGAAVTCTKTGEYYYSCFCGQNEQNADHTFMVAALGHSYGNAIWLWEDDGHSATCTRTCTRSGCTTNTTGHTSSKTVTLGNGITDEIIRNPTCTTKGRTRYDATATVESVDYSNSLELDNIDMFSHLMTGHAAVDATCAEAGNLLYYTCSRPCCEDKYYKKSDAHTTEAYDNQAATVAVPLPHDSELLVNSRTENIMGNWQVTRNEVAVRPTGIQFSKSLSGAHQTVAVSGAEVKQVLVSFDYQIVNAGSSEGWAQVYVSMLDENNKELYTKYLLNRIGSSFEMSSPQNVSMLIYLPEDTRYVKMMLIGKDQKNLTGNYGPIFSNMSIKKVEALKKITCMDKGTVSYSCKQCGNEYIQENVATDHLFNSKTLTASPVEDGLYAYACDYGCGTHNNDHIIKDFKGTGNHLKLKKDEDGYYTVENITLADSIPFVSPVDFYAYYGVTFNRNFVKDGGMYSFIVPFDIPAKKAAELGKFYKYDNHSDGAVYFVEQTQGVMANTAYFFEPAKDTTSIYLKDIQIKAATSLPDAAHPELFGIYGAYSQTAIPEGAYGYGDKGSFVNAGKGNTLSPYRAYLWLGGGVVDALKQTGDVNGDGSVNIADLSMLIEILNGRADDKTGAEHIDKKEGVTINDVETLKDILLGKIAIKDSDGPDSPDSPDGSVTREDTSTGFSIKYKEGGVPAVWNVIWNR
ncbi:MAG: leucine-rich repeat protein [Bacteroidaceae bacterium]|nr:leucine-rich repeat protein [Bacteroidaceae bacterium]